MNDFNAILGKMKNWANAAGKKTEEVVETSKLKLQIVSLNGDLSKAYEELGALVYSAAKNNDTVGEEMDAVMEKIDSIKEKLAEVEGKVGELKKERTCGNCGAVCAADATFCSRCGVILEAVESCEAEIVCGCEECAECKEEPCCCEKCDCESCEGCQSCEGCDNCEELCADEDCCGNCHCTGDCETCDDHSNKTCDKECGNCDCCEEEGCESNQ